MSEVPRKLAGMASMSFILPVRQWCFVLTTMQVTYNLDQDLLEVSEKSSAARVLLSGPTWSGKSLSNDREPHLHGHLEWPLSFFSTKFLGHISFLWQLGELPRLRRPTRSSRLQRPLTAGFLFPTLTRCY